MKKRIFISLVAIAFLLVGIRVGTTSAYFISEDKVTNNFQNGDIDIEVEEPDFEPPSEGWSGQKINKKVQVKNESIIPVLVRVNITPRWSIDKEGNSPFSMGNASEDVVKLNLKEGNLITSINGNISEKWIKGNDGYYYYTSILNAEETTNELLESVQAVVDKNTVGENFVGLYKDKYLQVDVKSEAIQVSEEACKKLWNIDINDKDTVADKTICELLDKIIKGYKES